MKLSKDGCVIIRYRTTKEGKAEIDIEITDEVAKLEEENEAPKRYEHDTDGLSCWCRPTPIVDNVWVHKKWSEFLGYVKQLEDTYGSVGFAKTCMQRDQNKAIHLKDENEALKQESERLNGVLDEINEVTQRTEIKVDALLENMRADTLEDK